MYFHGGCLGILRKMAGNTFIDGAMFLFFFLFLFLIGDRCAVLWCERVLSKNLHCKILCFRAMIHDTYIWGWEVETFLANRRENIKGIFFFFFLFSLTECYLAP